MSVVQLHAQLTFNVCGAATQLTFNVCGAATQLTFNVCDAATQLTFNVCGAATQLTFNVCGAATCTAHIQCLWCSYIHSSHSMSIVQLHTAQLLEESVSRAKKEVK